MFNNQILQIMRHKIIVFLLAIVTAFTAVAAQQGVFMEYHRKSKSGNTQVPRSPMRLPINIVYDSDTNYLYAITKNFGLKTLPPYNLRVI